MINTKDLVNKNIAVVGRPKSGKTTVISKLVQDLKLEESEKSSNFIIITDSDKIEPDKNTLVFVIKNKMYENVCKFLDNTLTVRGISQFMDGEIHKTHLTIIFDGNMSISEEEALRKMTDKINKLENTNYMVSVYSADNGYKNIDVTIEAEKELSNIKGEVQLVNEEN